MIKENIEELERIKKEFPLLDDDFDGEGAKSIKESTVQKCEKFLNSLDEKMKKEYSMDFPEVYIFPGHDGDISLEWDIEGMDGYDVIVIVKESDDSNFVYLAGDDTRWKYQQHGITEPLNNVKGQVRDMKKMVDLLAFLFKMFSEKR